MDTLNYTYANISGAGRFCKLQVTGGRKLSDIRHTHDFYEIVLVITGSMLHEINGREYENKTGDYVILRPGDSHRIVSQSPGTNVICLSVEKGGFELFAEIYDVSELCDFSPEREVKIFNIGDDFNVCTAASEKGSGESGEIQCKKLLSVMLANYGEQKNKAPGRGNGQLCIIAEKMKKSENLCEGLSAFLRLSGYSHTHLARLVKREFGCTLHEYIFKLRLEEAYRRIVFTGEHFESISQNIGYESFSHFNRIFKAHYGITPSQLRKKHGFTTV